MATGYDSTKRDDTEVSAVCLRGQLPIWNSESKLKVAGANFNLYLYPAKKSRMNSLLYLDQTVCETNSNPLSYFVSGKKQVIKITKYYETSSHVSISAQDRIYIKHYCSGPGNHF